MRSRPSAAASSTNGRGSSGPIFMSTRRIVVVAELHALAALRHGVGVEDLVADRRPEQTLRLVGLLDVLLGQRAITLSPGSVGCHSEPAISRYIASRASSSASCGVELRRGDVVRRAAPTARG